MRSRATFWDFYRHEFPRVFRETWKYTALAFMLFMAGALAGFFASLADPAFQRFFLGPEMSATIDRREMWTHSVLTIKPLASSAIMTNNLTVSFTMFAVGIMGGIGTVYLLAMNGVMIGVIGAACWQAGMSLQLWSFVAPHGILELPAVFIAGGGGLASGARFAFPGELPRRESVGFLRRTGSAPGVRHHPAPGRGGSAGRIFLSVLPSRSRQVRVFRCCRRPALSLSDVRWTEKREAASPLHRATGGHSNPLHLICRYWLTISDDNRPGRNSMASAPCSRMRRSRISRR